MHLRIRPARLPRWQTRRRCRLDSPLERHRRCLPAGAWHAEAVGLPDFQRTSRWKRRPRTCHLLGPVEASIVSESRMQGAVSRRPGAGRLQNKVANDGNSQGTRLLCVGQSQGVVSACPRRATRPIMIASQRSAPRSPRPQTLCFRPIRLASGAIPRASAATPPTCSYEKSRSEGNPGQEPRLLSHRPFALTQKYRSAH